jgi:hypothetical protein
MKITNYPNQNYFVVVAYGRRRQMEANKERLKKEYPQGEWWTTAELVREYRIYQREVEG